LTKQFLYLHRCLVRLLPAHTGGFYCDAEISRRDAAQSGFTGEIVQPARRGE
jgi:hypothetical protein